MPGLVRRWLALLLCVSFFFPFFSSSLLLFFLIVVASLSSLPCFVSVFSITLPACLPD